MAPLLGFFPTAEGCVQRTAPKGREQFNYVYNYTDHLGNVRVSYTKDPLSGLPKIVEESHYYPFGLKHTNYNSDVLTFQANAADAVVLDFLDPVDPLDTPLTYQYKNTSNYRNKKLIMKNIIFIFLCALIFSCKVQKVNSSSSLEYSVYKIDSINNYYLIYTKRNDSLFKIISEKQNIEKCNLISVNKKYFFKLHSIWNKEEYIGNSNVSLKYNNYVDCIQLNENTKICLERDSINDLHYADNIKGLCITKD